MTPEDVVLVVLPQFHVAAWNVQPLLAWLTGARVVVEPAFDPDTVLARVAEERVTITMGVPTPYQMLAERPGFAGADLSSLRLALVGGAPTPDRLLVACTARELPLVAGYGLTEAGPNVLCQAEPGGGMLPYPGVEVALRDPVTRRPVQGDRGELVVRGPNVFVGYWGRPDETARALAGGWLATGDLAERGPGGGYRLVGRSTAMYISGGENVHPGEVEQALLRDPGGGRRSGGRRPGRAGGARSASPSWCPGQATPTSTPSGSGPRSGSIWPASRCRGVSWSSTRCR